MNPLSHMLPSKGFDPDYLERMAPLLGVECRAGIAEGWAR